MRREPPALRMLRAVGEEMDAALLRMRRHLLPSEAELAEQAWREVREEMQEELPSVPPLGGPRWRPTLVRNWFPWRGRKSKRRWHT